MLNLIFIIIIISAQDIHCWVSAFFIFGQPPLCCASRVRCFQLLYDFVDPSRFRTAETSSTRLQPPFGQGFTPPGITMSGLVSCPTPLEFYCPVPDVVGLVL